MHKRLREFAFALVLGILIPGVLFAMVDKRREEEPEIAIQGTQNDATAVQLKEVTVGVVMNDGSVAEMDLEEYILCVVLREMPASFETEALKAQAVVARTYTLRRVEKGGKHTGAAVCTDPACCQGFRTQEEYLLDGGKQELLDKVTQAVAATAGEVLVYEDALIEATYFSCSGGKTEDAKAVWGSDIPYLQSTQSPGEEGATYYTDTVTFTTSEFSQKLGLNTATAPSAWLGTVVYTEGGGVDEIQIAGKNFKGTTIRQKLGLRSTAFMITIVGDTVTITTKGYGHRVGMSQYGADAMAVQGSSYAEILAHYYTGTELVAYSG